MLNNIIIMGRLVRDPELRMTQTQKPVVNFTVACERDFAAAGEEKEVDFIDCVAWNKTAEFVDKFFKKGNMAIVQGRLQFRSWQDKEEQKHNRAEVAVDRVWFGASKKNDAPKLTEETESDPDLPF